MATSRWIALLVAAGTVATARSVTAEAASLDDAWFLSFARAESLMCAASARGEVDSTDHAAVAEQIRLGVHVLGAVIQASVEADTVLARPLATPPEPPAGRRKYRVFKATGVISALASIAHLAATLSGAGSQTRSVLGYVGGSAAGVSGLFNRWMAHRPATDPIARMHAVDLETKLRGSLHETEFAAELLWVELRGMALDSCATDEQVVWLARRYANALQGTSVIIDSRIATSLTIARSCAQDPGFAAESCERCRALASHLDAVGASWRDRQWLFERSKRNALDYLVLADRP